MSIDLHVMRKTRANHFIYIPVSISFSQSDCSISHTKQLSWFGLRECHMYCELIRRPRTTNCRWVLMADQYNWGIILYLYTMIDIGDNDQTPHSHVLTTLAKLSSLTRCRISFNITWYAVRVSHDGCVHSWEIWALILHVDTIMHRGVSYHHTYRGYT